MQNRTQTKTKKISNIEQGISNVQGTEPAPNYGEAQAAESRNDLVHKWKICLKELRETKVWLRMIIQSNRVNPRARIDSLIHENDQLIAIFVKSIQTVRFNTPNTS